MNGVDEITFTAGDGENAPDLRKDICDYLGFLGVELDEEKNENSVLKGRFTKYITRRLEWHAIRYAAKNRPNVIVISLEQAPRHLTDIDAEQMFRKVEIELALQQEVQRLSPKEKEWLLCFLKMNYKEIQKHFGCGHTYVYEKRKKLAETMKALKE